MKSDTEKMSSFERVDGLNFNAICEALRKNIKGLRYAKKRVIKGVQWQRRKRGKPWKQRGAN